MWHWPRLLSPLSNFFEGIETDADLYDSVLHLRKGMKDKEDKAMENVRKYGMTNYAFEKHGVKCNPNLHKNNEVKENLRYPDGRYSE